MYFGRPVANLREFLPDEAIPPIKMGDGEAPVVLEFKHLGSMLSKNFDDSVTIMARIRSARIAFTRPATSATRSARAAQQSTGASRVRCVAAQHWRCGGTGA
jgi:hypothetical protein